ncbi:RDD family protein [uncultured Zhongshania sp.]|uniref:RDD family protein n=1 Tax=uncultured Zhongshania sp. TaxID=1642288 RepID=UPI0025EC3B4C|nr:RDD family protein [uncultured Zhongshania sp.]
MSKPNYAGFWVRVGASIIDTLLILLVLGPLITAIYGRAYWVNGSGMGTGLDVLLNYLLPPLAVILFWVYKSATPGKMVTGLRIIDARTGAKPTTTQFVLRYIGYYVSMIPLFLGILWVALDPKKQGWHDKIAGTVVVVSDGESQSSIDE